MRQYLIPIPVILLFCVFSTQAFSQTYTLTGTIRQTQIKVSVPAVSVTIKGTVAGTFTDDRGHFRLVTAAKPPFVLIISSIGFETQEVKVENAASGINIKLRPASSLGREVVPRMSNAHNYLSDCFDHELWLILVDIMSAVFGHKEACVRDERRQIFVGGT